MHNVNAISIAVERFHSGIFLINGNFKDEKSINSFIIEACSSRIFIKRKASNNL